MSLVVADLVKELPKSKLPAGAAVEGGDFVFFVSGPKPLLCDVYIRDSETLVLSTGGNAAVHIGRKRFSYSTDCWALDPLENKVSGEFLYQYLLFKLDQIDTLGFEGSGLRHLKKDFLRKFPVPEFSKPEQAKIAEILAVVDRAIEQVEALITKQQRIKTGLMQVLLTRGIDEHGNLRTEQTHMFKDSPLGRIPEEWELKRLGESSDVCNGFRKPISSLIRENMKGDYPYYGPTGILDYINEYRVDGKFVLIGEDGDHYLKYKTQEMTLLVEGKFNVNNHAHVLRGKGKVLTEWLHLFFLHRDITSHLTRQGAGRFKLNKAALLDLPLAAPKEQEEQYRVLNVMNTLRKTQTGTIENLAKLRFLKTALMQDLLTGRKSVASLIQAQEIIGV